MIAIIWGVIQETIMDCVKMVPFLFVAFLIIEAMEHYSGGFLAKLLAKVGKAGPLVGAVVGCVPQCGFSVLASNLYAGGVIPLGTLLAVFVSTSDEAILILMGNPGQGREILTLIGVKVVIAAAAGYFAEMVLAKRVSSVKESGALCKDCGCDDNGGIVKPALNHTVKILGYLFVFTGVLNLCIQVFGIGELSAFLLGDTLFQPLIAAAIGLIPNCAASVILTQLYLNSAISFASVVAGLCTGAGVGLVVLFRMNRNRRENLKILGILWGVGAISGVVLQVLRGI